MEDKRRERILMLTVALVVITLATLSLMYFYVSELLAIVVGVFIFAVTVILIIEGNERNQVRDLLRMLLEYEAAKTKVEHTRQLQHLQVLKGKQQLNNAPEPKLIEQQPTFDPRLLKEPEWTEGWTLEEEDGFKIVEAATERR